MSLYIYRNKKNGMQVRSKRRLHDKNLEIVQEIRSTDINNQDQKIWRRKGIQPN